MVEYRRSDIPEIYSMKKTSPLEITIQEGDNQVEIDLAKKSSPSQ